ncbi:universal stress protein [Kitasatospora sp. NPDC089797]|uniref:universal stress protein n=1 Tax=Kitasatospora sp. NPDC089797 TaxID=3155298 RepID=UPI00342EB675
MRSTETGRGHAAPGTRPTGGRRIVVGVDGSPASRRALAWAVEEAWATGGEVEAVTCWLYPVMYGAAMARPDVRAEQAAAGRTLARTVAEVVGDRPAVPVRRRLLLGNTQEELTGRSRGAALLVLGTRRRRVFGPRIGPTARHCMKHAGCQVVVVPEAGQRPA